MTYLASCSLEEARKYKGIRLAKAYEKTNSKTGEVTRATERVLLNVVTDDIQSALEDGIGSADMVTFTEWPGYTLPSALHGKAYYLTTPEDKHLTEEVQGLTLLVEVTGTPNLRDLVTLCATNSTIRITGGNLLAVPGLRIGRLEDDEPRKGVKRLVFKEGYDTFTETTLESLLPLDEIVPRVKQGRVPRERVAREPAKSSKAKVLTSMFGSAEVEL